MPALLPITSKPGEDFVDPAGDSLLPVLTFDCPMSMHRLSFPPHLNLVGTFLKYSPYNCDGDEHRVFYDNNDELMMIYEPFYKNGDSIDQTIYIVIIERHNVCHVTDL